MERPIENAQNGFDIRDSQYFSSLPIFIQESLMQSGGMISSEQSLREAAENLINEHKCS